MNAVEIEEAVSELASAPCDVAEFPFAFLMAFGNKDVTIKALRMGRTNKSDVGGVLQRNNIHLAVAQPAKTGEMLRRLQASPETSKAKAKFILSTDGAQIEAEDLNTGETLACTFSELGNNFGFFLPLAGISTVREVKNNPIDIKATGRLNKLYVELLKENVEWGTAERRQDLNRFMARLIFCFFAEDTGIFNGEGLFTATLERMSDSQSGNTHEVISELFRAMKTRPQDRAAASIRPWADVFPYVNGGLFSRDMVCPQFSRIARSYLLRAGELNWQKINPDIFGSMIQAVADDDERGELGMHYTSVPNIQKVLDPLFLDDLRAQLERAGTNKRKLLNLRKRLASIRVFDPACGSGNFLVIAYIRMREIEEELMHRRGEALERSWIKLTQFYGIEIKSFAAEIARLSLLIAEFQCDVRMIGQKEARALILPLHATGNIVTGNALRRDWPEVCPPPAAPVPRGDLFGQTPPQEEIDFERFDTETYVCGNPPYYGSRRQGKAQKSDLELLAKKMIKKWKSLDYVAGWFIKARQYSRDVPCIFAFVSTSSITEGLHVSILWPHILGEGHEICFGYRPFKWANLAANNAGVSVVIVGVGNTKSSSKKTIFADSEKYHVENINPYIASGSTVFVQTRSRSICGLPRMIMGSMPRDGGNLIISVDEKESFRTIERFEPHILRKYLGSDELINGSPRYCFWIRDEDLARLSRFEEILRRLTEVQRMRSESPLESTREFADRPHRFVYLSGSSQRQTIVIAGASSENRPYLPVGLLEPDTIVSNLAFAVFDGPTWLLAVISSKMHLSWISAVCGKLETRYRYSNTLGWNTFPLPSLTEANKADLTRCAEDILLAREAHFPASIAELYDPEKMTDDLRAAHNRNDETLERIYIGRRFRNDTERLEKLFDMYTKMTAKKAA